MTDIFAETAATLRQAGIRQRDIAEQLEPAVAAIHEPFVRKYLDEGPQPGVTREELIRRVAEYVTAGGMAEYEVAESLTAGPDARAFHFSHMLEQAKRNGLLDKIADAAKWQASLRAAESDRDRILDAFQSALIDAQFQLEKALEPPPISSIRKTRMPEQSSQTAPEQPDPMRNLIGRLKRGAAQIAHTNPDLAQRIEGLSKRAEADPARMNSPEFRTVVACVVQDLERATGRGTIPMPGELRAEMKQRAVSYPGLQNERMLALLRETASMGARDAPLIRSIREAGRRIAGSADQNGRDAIERIEVLENRLRLAPEAAGKNLPQIEALPPEPAPAGNQDGNTALNSPKEVRAAASPGSGDRPAAKQPEQASAPQMQPQTIQIAQPAKQGAVGAIFSTMRAPTPHGPPPWAPPPAALGERVTLFAQRLADGKTDRLLRAAERSGHAALDALDGLRAAPGAAVLGKIEAAASTEPGGMQAVMAEMRPDGRYAGLADEFAATLQQEKGFAAALTRAIDAAGQYGTDRVAVAQDFEARKMDVQQLDARFDRADQAIGDFLSQIPGKQPGKTALDELAENAVKLLRKAMAKVREFVAPKHEIGAAATPSPSPSPAMAG